VSPASGFFSSLGVTLSLSGDNVAVYLPILATGGLIGGTVAIVTWLVADLVLIAAALSMASHPKARSGAARIGPLLLPIIYLLVGLVVLYRAGTL